MVHSIIVIRHRLIILLLICLGSCKLGDLEFDGVGPPVYEAQIAVAMAEANYSLTDLILGVRDSSLTINEAVNGLLTLTYRDSAEFKFSSSQLSTLISNPSAQFDINLQNQTIPMTFFDEFESGLVEFEEPKITYSFFNTYGVPLGLSFDVFSARDDQRNETFELKRLDGEITGNTNIIEAAPAEDIGVNPARTNVFVTHENSNLPDLFSFLPLSFVNNLVATVNPNNETITGNVLGNDAGITITTQIDLPLKAVVDSLVTIIDFNMNEGLSFGEADSVTLRIVTFNSTPLDGHMIMEFYNFDSLKIYDVPQSLAFTSATVGTRQKTIDPEVFIDDIPLDSTGVRALANTAYINAFISMNSFKLDTRDIVSFFSQYELDITVTAIVQIEEEF